MSSCPSATGSAPPSLPTRRQVLSLGLGRSLGLSLALGSAAALSGCIMVPVGRYPRGDGPRGDYPQSAPPAPGSPPSNGAGPEDEVVGLPPPAPQVEVWVAAPGPGFFWIAGHWIWRSGRHFWVGGRWHPHRSGWSWVPHSWHRHPRGWRAAPGHWRRH